MKKEGKHKHGMKVPEDYFESFDERLFERMYLESLPEETGFEVPAGYFDAIEEKILQKVNPKPEVKVIPFFQRNAFMYASGIAATLLLAIFLFINDRPEEFSLELADIEAYIDENGMDYDSYDVAQVLTEDDLETLTIQDIFSEENLEDYLLEHLDDTNLLIE